MWILPRGIALWRYSYYISADGNYTDPIDPVLLLIGALEKSGLMSYGLKESLILGETFVNNK